MIKVSEEFKKAVYAPSRMCGVQITFEMVNKKAQLDNGRTIKTSDEALISRKNQLTNSIRRPSYQYATFEPNRFKLDGGFRIPPKIDEAPSSEVGWLSSGLSREDLTFDSNPYIDLTLITNPPPSFGGLYISFDPLGGEYATEFRIEYIDENGVEGYIEVTKHDSTHYQIMKPFNNIVEVKVIIKKWSKPYRRARVAEINLGIIQVYGRDEIINFNLLKEIDPLSLSIPSDELNFTIDNSNKDFNILVPNSLYQYLREKQELFVEMGVEVTPGNFEYISVGKYYLSDWKSDEGSLTASFTARDVFEYLGDIYKNSILSQGSKEHWSTLYQVAERLLMETGVPYNLDPSLNDIKTQGYIPIMPYREALQLIANSGGCTVYQSKQGSIVIEPVKWSEPQEVSLDNIYTDPQISLDKQVKYINIRVNRLRKGPLKEFFNGEVDLSNSHIVSIEAPMWNALSEYEPPNITVLGGDYTIMKKSQHEQVIKISSSQSRVNVIVSGYEIAKEVTIETIENPKVREGITLEVDNPLVNTPEGARKLGAQLVNLYNNRANYVTNWRQNPALECGDTVLIENIFGNKKSIITKQTFEYDGALKGTTESRGEV